MRVTLGIPSHTLRAVAPPGTLPAPSSLTVPRYLWLSGAALALTGAQLALLPRWLSAEQFGLVVLGISVTQGVLQLGDLGFSRLCLDARKPAPERERIRAEGLSLTLVTTAAVVIAAALGWTLLPRERAAWAVLAFGALAAAAVGAAKFRAAALEVGGDEQGAATENFLWTNAPKVGLVASVLAFRSAAAVLAASAAAGVVLARPARSRLHDGLTAVRRSREWVFPFVSIAAGFVLTWSDTYFLGAYRGLEAAGAYEAVYRVLGVCTYGFLPWASVVTSRVSLGEVRPLAGPLGAALGTTAGATIGAGLVLAFAGRALFPRLELPLDAVAPLVVFYGATTVAACVGSALCVRGDHAAVTRASVVSAAMCLAGHAVFTVGGGAAAAAWVAASAMVANASVQVAAYRRPAAGGRATRGLPR